MLIGCSLEIVWTAKLSRISYQISPLKLSSTIMAVFEISGKIISFIFVSFLKSLVCDSEVGNYLQKKRVGGGGINHWLGSIWVFQKKRAQKEKHEEEVYDWINIKSADFARIWYEKNADFKGIVDTAWRGFKQMNFIRPIMESVYESNCFLLTQTVYDYMLRSCLRYANLAWKWGSFPELKENWKIG